MEERGRRWRAGDERGREKGRTNEQAIAQCGKISLTVANG